MNTKFTLTALIAVMMLCICYISYVHLNVGLESVIKYIKNSNDTSLLTWEQNKTLDTADNTNM